MKNVKKAVSFILVFVLICSIMSISTFAATQTWPTTQSGSSGTNVYALQYLLNHWGYGPTLTVDGAFGTNTATATKNFQKAKGLTQDGIVGTNTWTALTSFSQSTSSYSANATKAIQYLLKNKFSLSITVDGVFGTATKNAVIAFQKALSLTQDGIVGTATWNNLIGASARVVSPITTTTTTSKPYANYTRQQKRDLLGIGTSKYSSAANASKEMTTVTVNIWTYPNNDTTKAKVSATKNVTVNKAIADDFKNIMQEIYNLPEKFPIWYYSAGGYYQVEGYNYRNIAGTTTLSYHSYGGAVDINAYYNPQSSSASYTPSSSVYRVTTNVVNIFKAHGWGWGGNFTSSSDWMHFSFGEI